MNTRDIAVSMVMGGLLLSVGLTTFRAASCGYESQCDEYWNTAGLTASGAVGMGWAWLTQAPSGRPTTPPKKTTSRKPATTTKPKA